MAEAQRMNSPTDGGGRSARDLRDQELYDAWSRGDGHAGNRLFHLYFKRVREYFVNRARGEHEDLVQETFTRLLEKHGDYQGGSFRAFVFGIARLTLFEFYRER
ncbi:MAG: hypothetical protein KC457_23490, partial [Myxococcales bacterium]|nr:hypothetical protein [Myxococcales bacterium]